MVTWGLTPTTQRVAEWVLARWPQLRITSGRRSLDEQIRVMTRNTRRYGRDWIQRLSRAKADYGYSTSNVGRNHAPIRNHHRSKLAHERFAK
jgi:hypothetical protein